MAFVAVCPCEAVAPGGMGRFNVGDRALAIYRVADRFYATAAICTHEHADLTEGELDGLRVSCPLHGARFDIATGRVLSPPAFKPLRTFPVRVAAGQVEVDLP